jgi:hypothetical protein
MSSLMIAAILLGFVATICLLLIGIHKKNKKEAMNKLLNHFNQLAFENNIRVSSQEILNHLVLGLDGINRKMLVVTVEDENYRSFLIDLREVKNCSVKKVFGTIKAGDLKRHKLEQYLEKIVLNFELHREPPVQILFYRNITNHIYEMQELEQKAKHWETALFKMITPQKIMA